MSRAMKLVPAFLLLAVTAGCPHSTDAPIAEPRPELRDDRLLGDWIAEDEDGGPYGIRVLPFNEAEYYVEIDEADDEPTRFRVYLFAAGEERLLHIDEISAERASPEYVFARYELTDESRLVVRLVDDELPANVEPAALVDFLSRSADHPGLYEEEDVVVARRR